MSNQPIRHQNRRLFIWAVLFVLMGSGLHPPTLYGEGITPGNAPTRPLLVKVRQGDTPASLARRYLNDASKGWMIVEYNGITAFSGSEAVLVPVAPFRIGGLTPDGYQSVPVMAYSDIGASPQPAEQVWHTAFNRHLHWLETQGFKSITPNQLVDFMDFSGQLPHRSVLITVDTESQTFYNLGVPVLKALGLTATVFVATDLVGSEGAMNWDQIRQLHEDGFTIACRGQSGRSLTHRTKGQTYKSYFNSVASELQLARKAIQTHINTPCLFLAYPQGDTNELISAMAAKLGFSAAFIRSPGENPFFADRFGIHRSPINSRMSLENVSKNLTTRIKADLN